MIHISRPFHILEFIQTDTGRALPFETPSSCVYPDRPSLNDSQLSMAWLVSAKSNERANFHRDIERTRRRGTGDGARAEKFGPQMDELAEFILFQLITSLIYFPHCSKGCHFCYV